MQWIQLNASEQRKSLAKLQPRLPCLGQRSQTEHTHSRDSQRGNHLMAVPPSHGRVGVLIHSFLYVA